MNSSIFRRLYSQIVIPLVAAVIVVGVVATATTAHLVSRLTEGWVDEVASSVSEGLAAGMDMRADSLKSVARIAAESSHLVEAIDGQNPELVEAALVSLGERVDCDELTVVGPGGRVVTTTSESALSPGYHVGEPHPGSWEEANALRVAFLEIGGRLTLSAVAQIPSPRGEGPYHLLVTEVIDEDLLANLGAGAVSAHGFYDDRFNQVAWTAYELNEDGAGSAGPDAPASTIAASDPALSGALEEALGSNPGAAVVEVAGAEHNIVATRVELGEGGTHGYLVALVSRQPSEEARMAATGLVLLWSVIAVTSLAGLGGLIARRVSSPLVSLTEGAQRIADGDFSTKIKIKGKNEIADLADSFNQMTESLKDRSDSLTKKVLELATLYEMSRALGATLDLDRLLDSVLESALRIFGADVGYVVMRERESADLEIRARSQAVPDRVDDSALRSSMSEWVVREARPLIFNPSSEGPQGQVEVVTGAMAALCVPLMTSDGAVGAITIGSQDPEFRFGSDDVRLLSTIANHVTIAIGNIELFSSLQEAYLTTVRSLAVAVDAKDPYTRGHSDGVALYATMIAERMGLSHDQQVALEMAAYLHDIGKIGVKEEILLKPGRLTEEEMAQMSHHPLIGANILKPVAFPWPIVPVVRHHHEWWDGGGYPAGLKGDEIPLLARILTAADAYEAMISDRPYRNGRTVEEAVAELKRCAGSQFDPAVVDALVSVLSDKVASEEGGADAAAEEVGIEEARAIFVALCEGMFVSFGRLGGPRLTARAEARLSETFAEAGVPVTVASGSVIPGFEAAGADGSEIAQMRDALRLMDVTIGSLSGHSLIDHFYSDAMECLPERMRRIAVHLEFCPG